MMKSWTLQVWNEDVCLEKQRFTCWLDAMNGLKRSMRRLGFTMKYTEVLVNTDKQYRICSDVVVWSIKEDR